MANKPIPQRELGTALRSFFDHVTTHDEEGVEAAVCMVVNKDPQDPNNAHICNFGAGDPDMLARVMIVAIDELIVEAPGFAEAWKTAVRAKYLKSMIEQVADVMEETKGMEAAKLAADALFEKLKGNLGAMPGPDTKQ